MIHSSRQLYICIRKQDARGNNGEVSNVRLVIRQGLALDDRGVDGLFFEELGIFGQKHFAGIGL